MDIRKKLLAIQSELKAPKNQYNSFAEFHYRSCEDILSAAKPLCEREGLLLLLSDEVVQIGERYYVKATACVDDGEKQVHVSAFARETESRPKMDAAQLTGSASSYARKYALNGLFCLDDTKDADAMKPVESTPKPAQKPAPKKAAKPDKAALLKQIAEGAKKHSISADDMKLIMKRQYDKESSKDLTDAETADLAANFERYAIEMVEDEGKLMEDIPL